MLFNGNHNFIPLPNDFTSAFYAISNSVDYKSQFGIFESSLSVIYWHHREIIEIMSYNFMLFGKYYLNISSFNAFFSTLIAINFFYISKYYLKFDIKKCYRISVIITFFPIFLISSYFARDTFAIFLVSFSLLYFLITENIFLKIILFISLIFTLYIHRTIYPVALILISIYYFASRRNINVKNKFNSFLIFFSSAFIFIFFSGYFLNSLNNLNYLDEVLELNILLYPVKLLLSLVGPFPWYQYFVSERIVDSYLFQNMLQAVFNISLFITLFCRINFFKTFHLLILLDLFYF